MPHSIPADQDPASSRLCFNLPAWCALVSGHLEREKSEDFRITTKKHCMTAGDLSSSAPPLVLPVVTAQEILPKRGPNECSSQRGWKTSKKQGLLNTERLKHS